MGEIVVYSHRIVDFSARRNKKISQGSKYTNHFEYYIVNAFNNVFST